MPRRSITKEQRQRIIELYISGDVAAANAEAARLLLAENYAAKLVHSLGLLPKKYEKEDA